jgi:hypothetical protein
MVKYVVRLQPEEREQLLALVNTGRAAAVKLRQARILLKADAGDRRCCWTDAAIAEALDTSAATVHRVRQAFVAQGLEAAVARKRPTGRQYRKLDGRQEAQLIAVTCSAPRKADSGGLSRYWRTSWLNWTSLTASVRSVSARH